MKSPLDAKRMLRRDWLKPHIRASRLLGEDVWPIEIRIGLPSPQSIISQLDAVKRHIDSWRTVKVGEVIWSERLYRAASEPIRLPARWRIDRPTDWVIACDDPSMTREFEVLSTIIEGADPIFHEVLVRRRILWQDKPAEEVVLASQVAMDLRPGYAEGRPLRTLSLRGIDSKFFERHERLVTKLLDQRFDGEVSMVGLESFLDALPRGDHWVLVMDLDGGLMPFHQQRVRTSELQTKPISSPNILIVENEHCGHLLPSLDSTIAVLGSGFDLGWTGAEWLAEKRVGYWGDVDTWGLTFLAQARGNVPHLTPLMMNRQTFEDHEDAAVGEEVRAMESPPSGLTPAEVSLYKKLYTATKGRLEQEFIAPAIVEQAVKTWGELA